MSGSIFTDSTDLGYALDAARYAQAAQISSQKGIWNPSVNKTERDNSSLTFEDMLLLMVTQLQNQTIDNQADTNDMMNQLIQMTVMQAITEMSQQVEDLTNANVMSYASSLVGKEVTIGIVDPKTGALAQEIVGTVTATGVYNGQQVIFIGDKYYPLSSIMAVGTLPEKAVDGTTSTKPSEGADGTGTLSDGTSITSRQYTDGEGNTVREIVLEKEDGSRVVIRTTGKVTIDDSVSPAKVICDTSAGGYTEVECRDADGEVSIARNEGGILTAHTDGTVTESEKTSGETGKIPGEGEETEEEIEPQNFRSINGILIPDTLPIED